MDFTGSIGGGQTAGLSNGSDWTINWNSGDFSSDSEAVVGTFALFNDGTRDTHWCVWDGDPGSVTVPAGTVSELADSGAIFVGRFVHGLVEFPTDRRLDMIAGSCEVVPYEVAQ